MTTVKSPEQIARMAANNARIAADQARAGVTPTQQATADASALASMNRIRAQQGLAPQTAIGVPVQPSTASSTPLRPANEGQGTLGNAGTQFTFKDGSTGIIQPDGTVKKNGRSFSINGLEQQAKTTQYMEKPTGHSSDEFAAMSPAAAKEAAAQDAADQTAYNNWYGQTEQSIYDSGTGNQQTGTGMAGSTTGRPVLDGTGYYTDAPNAPQSLQDVRQDTMARYQEMVNATNDLYNTQVSSLQKQGAAAGARVGSMDIGAGLAGSNFAQSNQNEVQAATNEQIQQVAAQREAQVAGFLKGAYDTADNLYQQGIQNYNADRTNYENERDSLQTRQDKVAKDAQDKQDATKKAAVETIGNLAKGGYSIDEMKPADYQQLLQRAGMSDFEARAVWSMNSPEANASQTIVGGMMVQQYYDPHTQKMVVKTTALPDSLKGAKQVIFETMGDGQVVAYDPDNFWNTDGTANVTAVGGNKDTTGSDELLSVAEATTLGVPYGTTKGEAAAMGITPTGKEDLTLLSPTEAASLGVPYGTTKGEAATLGITPAGAGTTSSAEKMKLSANVESGRASLEEIKKDLTNHGQSGLSGDYLPPSFFQSGSYIAAANNLTDVIGRLRSGGAISADEEKKFESLLPGTFESPATTKFKIEQLSSLLDSLSTAASATSNTNAPLTAEERQYIIDQGGDPDKISFKNVGSKTLNSSITPKIAQTMSAKIGSLTGQCGHWYNQGTSGKHVGDSVASKIALVTVPKTAQPKAGMGFVMRVSGKSAPYGHIGRVLSSTPHGDGTFDVKVMDSNWHGNERLDVHTLNSSKFVGYINA